MLQWAPPPWPKPPPFKWTRLHDAALAILEQEVKLGPEAFLEWLKDKPGAVVIYLMITEGEGMREQLFQEVRSELYATPLPEGFPATLSDLLDDKGQLPRISIMPRVPPSENWRDIAEVQRRAMADTKWAMEHPKLCTMREWAEGK